MVERSDKMWSTGEGNGKPLQYSCLENPMNSMKRQKDTTLKDELPRSVKWSQVTQLCPTLPMTIDCSSLGSSADGILQARKLEWVASPFSRGSSQPRYQTQDSALQADSLLSELPEKSILFLRDSQVCVHDVHCHADLLESNFWSIKHINSSIWKWHCF